MSSVASVHRLELQAVDRDHVHLNDAAVYSGPSATGATWVLGLEQFDQLVLQTMADDALIAIDLEPNPSDLWRAVLVLGWGQRVEMALGPAFRIVHPKPKAP